jgi:hypothetical protein
MQHRIVDETNETKQLIFAKDTKNERYGSDRKSDFLIIFGRPRCGVRPPGATTSTPRFTNLTDGVRTARPARYDCSPAGVRASFANICRTPAERALSTFK